MHQPHPETVREHKQLGKHILLSKCQYYLLSKLYPLLSICQLLVRPPFQMMVYYQPRQVACHRSHLKAVLVSVIPVLQSMSLLPEGDYFCIHNPQSAYRFPFVQPSILILLQRCALQPLSGSVFSFYQLLSSLHSARSGSLLQHPTSGCHLEEVSVSRSSFLLLHQAFHTLSILVSSN